MKEIVKTVYQADDGTLFETERECEQYEVKLKEREKLTTYWCVVTSPDLTEGRGWYKRILVELYGVRKEYAQLYMQDWCHRTQGRPISFVQGVAPMSRWMLSLVDRDVYRRARPIAVGDYSYDAEQIRLVVGPGDEGLVEESHSAERAE